MAPRPAPPTSSGSFYPPNDVATYRDLLLFEERLKSNAASLNRRKRRYQLFLAQLLIIIAFLLCEVLLQTNLLGLPYTWLLRRVLPELYPAGSDAEVVRVHPYFASGLLFVAVTTLVLFFASGMYSEKIGYANKYVPHANRALRNFNMYLNMRQPPLRSKLPFNPFSLLFARPSPSPSPPSPSTPSSRRTRSPSPTHPARRSSSVPIPPIPPASNPRGELIFSSRVDRAFRDAYDRYRAQFERRRAERERAARAQTWPGWILLQLRRAWLWPWGRSPADTAFPGSPSAGTGSGAATPVSAGKEKPWGASQGSLRGRGQGSVGGTPAGSRKSSPVPGRQTSRKSSSGGHPHSPQPQQQSHPLAAEPKVGS